MASFLQTISDGIDKINNFPYRDRAADAKALGTLFNSIRSGVSSFAGGNSNPTRSASSKDSLASDFVGLLSSSDSDPSSPPGPSATPSSVPDVMDTQSYYVDAPLAQSYGMPGIIAYQEALVNTAHQREVKDLQAAGLNPVLSASYGGSSAFSVNNTQSGTSSASGQTSGKGLIYNLVEAVTGSDKRASGAQGIFDNLLSLFDK